MFFHLKPISLFSHFCLTFCVSMKLRRWLPILILKPCPCVKASLCSLHMPSDLLAVLDLRSVHELHILSGYAGLEIGLESEVLKAEPSVVGIL